MGKGKHRPDRRLRWLLEYALTLCLLTGIRLLPFSAALYLGGVLGRLAFRLDARHRRITAENLAACFPEKGSDEIDAIASSVYTNVGYSIVEFIRSARYKADFQKYFVLNGWDRYENALSKGKGVLLLTGHCGSWELIAMVPAIKGKPISVVVRPLDNQLLHSAVERIRTRFGNSMIKKDKGMREVLRALDGGRGVGILLDQNVTAREGVFVDFFGRPACTNKGLALLAMKTKAPVLPAFIRRVGNDRHEVLIGEELPLVDTGDKDADIKANTQVYTKAIEGFIRENPDQWFWMHRRWKTRPQEAVDA